MSDADVLGLLIVVLCLAASMFFSGSETAITSLDAHRAKRLVEDGGRQGRLAAFWVREPVRVLSTILVGNNIANTLMGAVVTALAIRHLEGGPWGGYAVGGAVFVTTVVLLILGEITPKALGKIYSERLALPALWVLRGLSKIMAPALWLLTAFTGAIVRSLERQAGAASGSKVTSDDIGYLVQVGQREGSIDPGQAMLLAGIVRFEAKIVRDIMIPANRITAVNLGWTVAQVREVALRSGHSRLPVYEGQPSNIKGVLHIKQLVDLAEGERVARVVRQPVFVSLTMRLHDLLQRFKEQRVHLAIVVDDAGDAVGIVSLEDVLEQIVGQIFDESDRAPLTPVPDVSGAVIVDGQDSLTRVEERLHVELPDLEGVISVGDLLTYLAGQIPIAGSVFVWEGLRFVVLEADARHVIRIRVEPSGGDESDDDDD
ncbi:hemolysin family protein [Nannocystis pusilla]|uniref:Hemolysin family protein n=1 Tax=Nannocystis pusilla TaxID=889268 RepID=A0ABS7U1Q5_9BACT|nr:hemolysin family protein [Nannocystis pusilla]MBZ5714458.1 hemolysin family protein [Nannocystis pusilla]